MKFLRYGNRGAEKPAVEVEGSIFDLTSITDDIDGAFLGEDGVAATRAALQAGSLPQISIDGERLGAPVAQTPAILCIGMNYVAHAAESGSAPPETPVLFLKHPGCIVGPFDEVHIPRGSEKTDWEVELAVVIGKEARYLADPSQSRDHIAGYTISNDVSERAFQIEDSGGQWSKGKCSETFNPLGPYLVTPDEVPDPQALNLSSRVNGEIRQDSNTRDMIFSVDFLIWHLSQYLVLRPGDIINTGTPQGVALSGRFPYLQAGDVMTLEISALGRQQQSVVAAH
ncbi:MAG: fumarylacetoacetate hydrolase family protein [Actinomycetota bacterium]|nr:fumarylacetoacetate hydrolase family protein [Actinomycetota bacterium]